MSLPELPKVDRAAENSDESSVALLSVLTRRNGFICRKEDPDYGVDFDVEIVKDGQVTGNKFAIQLKSTEKRLESTRDGTQYVCYPYPVGNLRVLAERTPGMGMIVLYCCDGGLLFFDHVENIYHRISEDKKDEGWFEQEKVTIRIPAANVLTTDSAREVWTVYRRRFLGVQGLLHDRGPEYGIPLLPLQSFARDEGATLTRDSAKILREYGFALLNSKDIHLLAGLIESVPIGALRSDPHLLLLSAITYADRGLLADASYYLHGAERLRDSYTEEECSLLETYKAQVAFELGQIGRQEYAEQLQRILQSPSMLQQNRIGIRIRLLSLQLSGDMDSGTALCTMENIQQDARRLSETDKNKDLLLVHVAVLSYHILMKAFIGWAPSLLIWRNFFPEVPLNMRVAAATMLARAFLSVQESLEEAYRHGVEKQDKYLVAQSLLQISRCFLGFTAQTSVVVEAPASFQGAPDFESLYQQMVGNAVTAYNEFAERGMLSEARFALETAYEIQLVFERTHKWRIQEPPPSRLLELIASVGKELGREEYRPIVEHLFNDVDANKGRKLQDLPEESDEGFAETLVSILGLPPDRKSNIVADLRAQRAFQRTVEDPNVQLLQHLGHLASPETAYLQKPTYAARCTICGAEVSGNENIHELIGEWRLRHGHWCIGRAP
ncbi:MAG: DUF4365 domain-containing protein [Deferrisomatales bacterium]|nr:DUF4365 domain-containing protein [Deferrisomatales bacterium]